MNFDIEVLDLLGKSKQLARVDNDKYHRVSHFVIKTLKAKYCIIKQILLEMRVDIDDFIYLCEEVRSSNITINSDKLEVVNSSELDEILKHAHENAKMHTYKSDVTIVDVFQSIIECKSELRQVLLDLAIDKTVFSEVSMDIERGMYETSINNFKFIENRTGTKKKTNKPSIEIIEDYCTLLTTSNTSKCIGRNREINEIAKTLIRINKRNVVLIGEAGVGKTNVVEGLVQKLGGLGVSQLVGKEIYQLNTTALVAGTMYRGQFEERVNALMKELVKNSNIILFIDELHTVSGTGNSSGGLDLINIMKPYLARNSIQVIAATTNDEYRKYIENDKAFKRRFNEIIVNEPSKDETISILKGLKSKYEKKYSVKISNEIISTCVDMAIKYMPYLKNPDKSIDLLNDVVIESIYSPKVNKRYEELKKKFEKNKQRKIAIIESKNYSKAESVLIEERNILSEMRKEQLKIEKDKNTKKEIKQSDIRNVIYNKTQIPVSNGTLDLGELKSFLKSKVKGQDEAIDIIHKTLLRNKYNLGDESKTVGNFMFVGSSGVGKTFLVKQLCEYVYNGDDSFIRVDCSEYSHEHEISKLIGAPNGYVGYGEGGILTNKVKRKPFSLVLFDEIEKAHPKLYDLLLQIMGEGRLSSSLGEVIDFKNCIIVLTSNIGVNERSMITYGYSNAKNTTSDGISKHFKVEFLNRIDNIVYFNDLSEEALRTLLINELVSMIDKCKKMDCKLSYEDSLLSYLLSCKMPRNQGFRAYRRKLQDEVIPLLTESMEKGEKNLHLHYDDIKKMVVLK